MNYQKLIIVGNATADAKHQQSKKGDVTYTTFRVGVSDGQERTTFFPVTVFGQHGQAIAPYINKGTELLVEGRIQVSDSGRHNVIADRVRLGTQPAKKANSTKKKAKK